MRTIEEAQASAMKRRQQLGHDEVYLRKALITDAQNICATLVRHPKRREVQRMLAMAEELREQLKVWLWGKPGE